MTEYVEYLFGDYTCLISIDNPVTGSITWSLIYGYIAVYSLTPCYMAKIHIRVNCSIPLGQ